MWALRNLLIVTGVVASLTLCVLLAWKACRHWLLASGTEEPGGEVRRPRWRLALALAVVATVSLTLGNAIVVVPPGHGGVRVSQLGGTRPGALLPGVHLIRPFVEAIALYDLRDRVWTAGDPKKKTESLPALCEEGLQVGLAISVRYRLDPRRLDQINASLPPGIDEDVVAPVVATTVREIVAHYPVSQVFSTAREEIRETAVLALTERLASDGLIVREVLLRDVVLPPEYAQGLEDLLLKEQQNVQLDQEIQIKEKQVRQAALEAEADKAREVKAAEGHAQVRVLQAKAEADAMQHTLTLKQKQIEQTRLEAEARKAATLKDAEASAEASIIKGKADAERDRLMAAAEANRIHVTNTAELERLKVEADLLRVSPLLVQKIVAERLSDKLQLVMVPSDGRFLFTNDVFKSLTEAGQDPAKPAARATKGR